MTRGRGTTRPLLACVFALVVAAFVTGLGLPLRPALAAVPIAPMPGTPPVPGANGATEVPEAEPEAPDSPRASMQRFIELGEKAKWADAAVYLDIPPRYAARGPELASRLYTVLAHGLIIHFDELSPNSKGEIGASPPPASIELGRIEDEAGDEIPIVLERRDASARGAARWVFNKSTVAHVDSMYAEIERSWARTHLPSKLLERGPKGLYRWQWIALPLLGIGCTVVGLLLAWFSGVVTRTVFLRSQDPRSSRWPRLLSRFKRPLALAWAVFAFWVFVPRLELSLYAEGLVRGVLGALAYLAFFWALLRTVGAFGEELSESAWAEERPTARTLGIVGVRFGKVIVGALAFMAALSQLGYSATSILAGLGLGGIALALAAQNTVEHLFGSIAILVDQPFRVGDNIRFGEVEGIVESIGLRSTRLRTIERSLVIVPNGTLADSQIESLTARDAIRFSTMLGIGTVPAPTPAAIDALREALRTKLAAHPKVRTDTVLVDLHHLGESSLDVNVRCQVETVDVVEFAAVQHELLLVCMRCVEEVGLELASPVRTLVLPSQRS